LFCLAKTTEFADNRRSLAASFVLVTALIHAANAAALPEDSTQPIQIDADSAELDENKNLATYHGNVRMEQGTMVVTADTMTIELKDQLVVRITAEGESAHYQQQLKPDESMVFANANTITYYTQEERVHLAGNAYLTQNKNAFTGESIHYDIREGKVDAQASGDGKVQMILQPATVNKQQ
jgi:lipopolysaccharide export system protein LptA